MTAAATMGTSWTAKVVRFVLAAAAVLAVFMMTAEMAAAEPRQFIQKANGVSIKERTQAQSNLCSVSGGTIDVTPAQWNGQPTGGTHTTCHGGEQHGMECINAKNNTWCSRPRTQPVDPGPGDGRISAEGTATTMQPESQPAATPQEVPAGQDRVVARGANLDDEQP